jgi:hypothetical protein
MQQHMANHVLLNNVDHKDMRILTRRSAVLGDSFMFAPTFHHEFRSVQAHYPIFFRKSPDGRYHAVAVFGFQERENLFLTGDGWDAHYVPLTVERQPFLIGFQQGPEDGANGKQPVIHVDIDSPRISITEGEPVFLKHGGFSDYLKRVNSLLHTIHEGFAAERGFIDALVEYDLLESFTLDVELEDESAFRVAGFHTIHEERLNRLSGEALNALNSKGYLQPAFMVLASLSNIRDLIARKKRRLEETS